MRCSGFIGSTHGCCWARQAAGFAGHEVPADFKPYRLDIEFLPCVEAPIRPLIQHLSFIKNKQSWGSAFMVGQLKVPRDDFVQISSAMGVQLDQCST